MGGSGNATPGEGGSWFMLIFLASGTLISFTVFGYAQEALTSKVYGDEKFGFTSFLVLLQSVGNSALAAIVLIVMRADGGLSAGVPVQEWFVVGLSYLGAHKFGLWALKYIIFPLQVICKSCKAIPVMFGEMIFARKQHKLSKKISVFLMCAGVVIFSLLGKKKKGDKAFTLDNDTLLGLALVFLALVCDGIYGPYQNKITAKYPKTNAYHLMFNMNWMQGAFSFALCVADGELKNAFAFVQKHPDVIPDLLQFSLAMALGNIFIYNLQRSFGALTVTTTTTLRKLISVLFSVVWFGHSIASAQWVGVGVVFAAGPISQVLAKPFEESNEKKKD